MALIKLQSSSMHVGLIETYRINVALTGVVKCSVITHEAISQSFVTVSTNGGSGKLTKNALSASSFRHILCPHVCVFNLVPSTLAMHLHFAHIHVVTFLYGSGSHCGAWDSVEWQADLQLCCFVKISN